MFAFALGQRWHVKISGIITLAAHEGQNHFPSGPETVRCGRKISFNGFSQFWQIVERHGGKHVVLDVILHVPVAKTYEPTGGKSAGVEAVVVDVGREDDVLRRATKGLEPAGILTAKSYDEDEKPIACGDGDGGEGEVAEQNYAGPIAVFATEIEVGFRNDLGEPISGEKSVQVGATSGGGKPEKDQVENSDWLDRELPDDKLDAVPIKTLGEHDFTVVFSVHCRLVMEDVARTVADMVEQSDEGVGAEK